MLRAVAPAVLVAPLRARRLIAPGRVVALLIVATVLAAAVAIAVLLAAGLMLPVARVLAVVDVPLGVMPTRLLAIVAAAMARLLALGAVVLVAVVEIESLPVLLLDPALVGRRRRGAEQADVVLGMLEEVLRHHPVARSLRVAGQDLIFLDDLLGRSAHLAFRTGAFIDAILDVALGLAAVVLVTIVAVLLRRSHLHRLSPFAPR
ncbi:hypothetical protein SAMN05444370_101438 [Rubrimonas cliftonensis]|uniref:Uncharacterized protein n=1 Tax=Rubrimonas cliftonensis TaxID=89524 RepID=A0A1H3W063_9RHOB|nr:hypothetical protein SAMN05444370_101438 [Rubrimonas cliftonensis]